jgi:prolyl-tRNA synthetase
MRQSQFPNFIRKEYPKDEEAYNAQVLIRAGFIDKLMAGVYSYLPLGLRVISRIEGIVRKHMDGMGSAQLLMPVLHPKENWQKTGRWDSLDVLFKIPARDKKEYALGPTHEEIVVPIGQKAIFSYKDLPISLYQIQTKMRDEARAKSGILRGREFIMKDMYSFHANKEDLEAYYARAIDAYRAVFKEVGMKALLVEASGGTFSKFSHEFQVESPNGEDTVIVCRACDFAQNKEINTMEAGEPCPKCGKPVERVPAIEVGNIFQLNTKYSEPFGLKFKDADGSEKTVIMGCYGIGISRLMGVLAELHHDDKGLIWPKSVAPFDMHLIVLPPRDGEGEAIMKRADDLYAQLRVLGIDVLYDDRQGVSAGEKFAESDLMGIPVRLVVSPKTGDKIEFKERAAAEASLVDFSFIKQYSGK